MDGLFEFLSAASKAEPDFNKRARVASERVADTVAQQSRQNANAIPGRRGSRSQAAAVADKLKAMRERVPVIRLDAKAGFVSTSRPNGKRKTKVKAGDVFFGAEFGGGRKKRTQQFPPHRGRLGYFFWQAVRERRSFINEEYSKAIDDVLSGLAPGAK